MWTIIFYVYLFEIVKNYILLMKNLISLWMHLYIYICMQTLRLTWIRWCRIHFLCQSFFFKVPKWIQIYGLLNIPGVITSHFSNLSNMAQAVLWIWDAVIDMTTWVLVVKGCSLTTKALNNCKTFNECYRKQGIVYSMYINSFDIFNNRSDIILLSVNFKMILIFTD